MEGSSKRRWILVYLACASLSIACVGPAPPPAPPDRPPLVSAFDVQFTPLGRTAYPASEVKEVKRYKTIAHWPGKPDWTSDIEVPSRPYVVVGQLDFPLAWHWLERGVSSCPGNDGLVAHHVGAIGGDAILACEVSEHARGVLEHPDTGKPYTVSYRSLSLEVIRYTDR